MMKRLALFLALLFSPLGAEAAYNPQVYTILNGQAYGMQPSATDNTATLTAAYNAAVATGTYTAVYIPCNGTYTLTTTSGFTWDLSKVGLISCGATLNFTSLAANTAAFTIIGTSSSDGPYPNVRAQISDIIIQGPGTANGNIGLNFVSSYDISHVVLRDVGVKNFASGEQFGNNAYLIHHEHVSLWENGNGINTVPGCSNCGENISYSDSAIFNNSRTAMELTIQNGDFNFVNTSIDYNGSAGSTAMLQIYGGEAHFTNCHFEAYAQQLLQPGGYSSVVLSFANSVFVQQTSSGSTPYIDLSGGNVLATFTGGRIIPNSGTSPALNVGSGTSVNFYGVVEQYGSGVLSVTGSANSYTNLPAEGNAVLSNTIVAPAFQSSGGIFLSTTNYILTSPNTYYTIGTNQGVYALRDDTSGGTALFNCDSTVGCTSIQNSIAGLVMDYTGGNYKAEVTSGTTPRTIGVINLAGQ